MSSRRTHSEEESFIAAYSDMIRTIEQEYGMWVTADYHITERNAVLCWHWTCQRGQLNAPGYVKVAHYTSEYPNARATSLAAFLFGSATRLAHMAEQWVEGEKRALNGA